jgi:hypothetical protein
MVRRRRDHGFYSFSRISKDIETQECTHLLAAVDSVELLSRRESSADPTRTSNILISSTSPPMTSPPDSTNALCIPSYLMPPVKRRPQLYARMSKGDWEALRKFEQPSKEQQASRRSTVSFDGSPVVMRGSRKSSILKNPSNDETREIDQEHNALHQIREKCREVIGKMKVEEVLRMLCDDDDDE